MTPTPTTVRKPLEAVQVNAEFVGRTSRQDVCDNAAMLSITDAVTGDEKIYRTQAIFDGETCLGFRLTFAQSEPYFITRDLSRCTCPDNTHRPGRPGGCRHMAALRQALPTVNR